jgi:hypothetical protein
MQALRTPILATWMASVILYSTGAAIAQDRSDAAALGGSDAPVGNSAPLQTPGQKEAENTPLAIVGDTRISVADLFLHARRNPNLMKQIATPEGRADVLRQMVETRVINLAAIEKAGLEPGYVTADLTEAVRRLEREEFAVDEVSDEDVEAYYQEHKDELGIPASVRVREIFIPVPEDADAQFRTAARAKAESTLKRIEEGAKFEDLATELAHTEALRAVAGDQGFLPIPAFPYLDAATADMREGEISDIIELDGGFQILQFLGRRDALLSSFESLKPFIRNQLETESFLRRKNAFVRAYGEKIGVTISDPALQAAWPPGPAGAASN